MIRRFAAAISIIAVFAVAATSAPAAPVRPVASVDVAKYLGTWKQLASIPQWFDALCLSNTSANYQLNPNGTVRVLNRCDGPFGLPIRLTGTARVADRVTNAELEVTFLNLFGRPIFSGVNYVIIGLAPDYSWAVVTDPRRSTAFVLSRIVNQPSSVITEIRSVLSRNEINACRLRVTKQQGGAMTSPPFC